MAEMDLKDFLTEESNPIKPQGYIKQTKQLKKEIVSPERKALELDLAQKNLVQVYKNEKKCTVRVAPSYARYFGRVMHVSINGISVGIRCDGSSVQLPESFAAEIFRRMEAMDAYENSMSRMADVKHNVELNPGQLHFFG